MVVYLDKQRVLAKLQDEKVILYNYIANILLDRVYTKRFISPDGPIELIASRRETNRFLNENFKDYLRNTFRYKHKGITRISIKTPEEEKGLQVVDFVSWAIFRKYEKGDKSYYDIIHEQIIEENPFYP